MGDMLRIDEDLINMNVLVDAVVCDLINTDEVKEYRIAQQAVESDEKLQQELMELRENADFIAFRPELRTLQQAINLNPKIYALKLAENDVQESLSVLTKKISAAISDKIFVDENNLFKGGNHHCHRRNN